MFSGGMTEVYLLEKGGEPINASVWAEMGIDGWEFSVIEVDRKITYAEERKLCRKASDQFFQ